jgi:hypothetical protein
MAEHGSYLYSRVKLRVKMPIERYTRKTGRGL